MWPPMKMSWIPLVYSLRYSNLLCFVCFFHSSHIPKRFRRKVSGICRWQTTVQTKCSDDWAGTLRGINLRSYVTQALHLSFHSCRYTGESVCTYVPVKRRGWPMPGQARNQETLISGSRNVDGTQITCKRSICKALFTRSVNLNTVSLCPTPYQYCCAGQIPSMNTVVLKEETFANLFYVCLVRWFGFASEEVAVRLILFLSKWALRFGNVAIDHSWSICLFLSFFFFLKQTRPAAKLCLTWWELQITFFMEKKVWSVASCKDYEQNTP